jgi:hypothetical protein
MGLQERRVAMRDYLWCRPPTENKCCRTLIPSVAYKAFMKESGFSGICFVRSNFDDPHNRMSRIEMSVAQNSEQNDLLSNRRSTSFTFKGCSIFVAGSVFKDCFEEDNCRQSNHRKESRNGHKTSLDFKRKLPKGNIDEPVMVFRNSEIC